MDVRVAHTADLVHVALGRPCRVLSSAVLNGGWVAAEHILNLRVAQSGGTGTVAPVPPPEETLRACCRAHGWKGNVVGLMTAASMASYRRVDAAENGVRVSALVTAGLSNARRAGDRAECRAGSPAPGTINLILLMAARLTPAAMVEAAMVATEAKAAVLQELAVASPVSGLTATGTGTDSIAVVSGRRGPRISFCGKHMLAGELIAQAVMTALARAVGTEYRSAAEG